MIFTATCSFGMEDSLVEELKSLNIHRAHPETAAVRFHARDLSVAYRACIQSRLASRILLRLHRFQGNNADDLYAGIQQIDWNDHLRAPTALWVDVVGTTKQLRHSQFTARLTKDAIVDQLRDNGHYRPSVDRDNGLRIHVHIRNGVFTVSLDLSGQSLHWRTPNRQSNGAPIKETLAAYLLWLSGWPERLKSGETLVDAMSGSGTIALEAASMALNLPPNLNRRHWGFQHWRGHQPDLFKQEKKRAQDLINSELPASIIACDIDRQCLRFVRENAQSRLISGIRTIHRDFLNAPPPVEETGLVLMNPPYGERLFDEEASFELFSDIGDTLKQNYSNWTAFILCPSKQHRHRIRLRHHQRTEVFNGQLRCQWLGYSLYKASG